MLIIGLIGGFVVGLAAARLGSRGMAVTTSHTDLSHSSTAAVSHSGKAASFDPEQVDVMLGNISTVPFQELYSVLSTLPPEKLQELAAQLDRLPDDKESAARVSTFFKAWAHLDPIAALRAATAFHSTESKTNAIGAVIDSADLPQAESLANAIRDLPEDAINREQRNNFLAATVTKWAQLAPTDAAKFFDQTQTGSLRFRWVASTIAQSWATQDPQAALSWAQAHSDGFGNAVPGAIMGWWSKDHEAAEAYVRGHLESDKGQQIATSLVSYMYSRDSERAKQWVSELPTPQARRDANRMLTMQMAFSDPKAASAYAAALPAEMRQESISTAVNYWASNDLNAPAEWINSLSGAPRDEATAAYINNLVRKDPATAAQWAVTISDAKARDPALQRVASEWLRKDPQQAAAWIQTTSLSDDEKQRLLALAPKH